MNAKPFVRSVIIFFVVALCPLLIHAADQSEPVYGGKALSEWLLESHRKPSDQEATAEIQKQPSNGSVEGVYEKKKAHDADAIRHIGTNSLPILLDMLGATGGNLAGVVQKLKAREFHEAWWSDGSHAQDLRTLAVDGFSVLGTNAESAVPQLSKLFYNAETSFDAARALTKVGPKGFFVLTNALNNPQDPFRSTAIWVLGEEAPADTSTVDALLIKRLNDPDDVNRHNAAVFMSGREFAAIPTLIHMLDEDTNYLVVSGAAEALSKFGIAAQAAAPKLFSIYTNHVVTRDRHDAETWAFASMSALKAIDPGTAAKAEAFLVGSGPFNYARNGYTITVLTNGLELIAGGYIHTEFPIASNKVLSSAQFNDPATGKWLETGRMKTPRDSHTATLLRDGRVLVAAGMDPQGHALASAELFDPVTGSWTEAGMLKTARFYHTAALQADGRVMVAGGHTGSKPIDDTEYYDPSTGTWSSGAAIKNLLPAARRYHSSTLLADGKLLVVGGRGESSGYLSTVELYDPASDTWTNTGSLNIARMAHQATLLPSGKVLVIGGNTRDASGTRAELFDPVAGTWAVIDLPFNNRSVCTITLLHNQKVLVTGIEDTGNRHSFAGLYDPATGKWTATSTLSDVREGYTATLLTDGKVLVAGGRQGADGDISVIADAELYDPASEKWITTRPMNVERWRHTASLLPNGKVLVAGGSGASLDPLSSAELYDPKSGKWTLTGSMRYERYDHTATLLPAGRVLVAGSFENAGDALSSAEVYSLATGKWTSLRRLNTDHTGHTATLLPNGKVLIVGGDATGRLELVNVNP